MLIACTEGIQSKFCVEFNPLQYFFSVLIFHIFFLVCKATLTHRSQSMLKSDTRYIGNDNDDGDGDEEEEAMGAIKVRTLAA